MELYFHSTAAPSLTLDAKDSTLKAATNIDVSVDTTGTGSWTQVYHSVLHLFLTPTIDFYLMMIDDRYLH
jgi:hypothetical protein